MKVRQFLVATMFGSAILGPTQTLAQGHRRPVNGPLCLPGVPLVPLVCPWSPWVPLVRGDAPGEPALSPGRAA